MLFNVDSSYKWAKDLGVCHKFRGPGGKKLSLAYSYRSKYQIWTQRTTCLDLSPELSVNLNTQTHPTVWLAFTHVDPYLTNFTKEILTQSHNLFITLSMHTKITHASPFFFLKENQINIYTLFVSAIMVSRKWVIFQKAFSIKLSYFHMFGNNFK